MKKSATHECIDPGLMQDCALITCSTIAIMKADLNKKSVASVSQRRFQEQEQQQQLLLLLLL
jgi:hypothetical protein